MKLDQLMENAIEIPKFRKYNQAYQQIDSEMTRILTDEEQFDTNILKLKQEYDICHIKKDICKLKVMTICRCPFFA